MKSQDTPTEQRTAHGQERFVDLRPPVVWVPTPTDQSRQGRSYRDHGTDPWAVRTPPLPPASCVEGAFLTPWALRGPHRKGSEMESSETAVREPSDQPTAHGLTVCSGAFALLVVAACGVVYGDIGTSVLYTLREIFFGAQTAGHIPVTQDNVLGAVSLIFWSLLLLITLKYICFVLYGRPSR
jgi:hypothetical protein